MNSPRSTIATMMFLVGMVAVSLAVGRALFAYDPWLPAGVFLAGLAIEVGLFRILRTRAKSLAFWVGFVVCGMLAASSFAWGRIVRSSIEIRGNATTGEIIMLPTTVFEQVGSASYTLWRGYLLLAVACLNRLPFGSALMGPDYGDPVWLTTAAVVAGLP